MGSPSWQTNKKWLPAKNLVPVSCSALRRKAAVETSAVLSVPVWDLPATDTKLFLLLPETPCPVVSKFNSIYSKQHRRFCGKIPCDHLREDYHEYTWGNPNRDPKANLNAALLAFAVLTILIVKFPFLVFLFFTKRSLVLWHCKVLTRNLQQWSRARAN